MIFIKIFVVLFAAFYGTDAFAADGVFKVAIEQGEDIFNSSLPILSSLGVLGILGVGGMAMSGKMPWNWAFAVIGGLSLLAIAPATKDWVEQIGKNAQSTGKFCEVAKELTTANTKLAADAKTLLYIAAGVSTVALGTLGIMGKFRWSWLFTSTVAMAIISSAVAFTQGFTPTPKAGYENCGSIAATPPTGGDTPPATNAPVRGLIP